MNKWEIIRYKKNGVNYMGRIAEFKQEGGTTYFRIAGQREFVCEDELIPLISVGDRIERNGQIETVEFVGEDTFRTDSHRYEIPYTELNPSVHYMEYNLVDDADEPKGEEEPADPLVVDIRNYLDEYNIKSANKGVNIIYDEWKQKKSVLIDRLSRHPNWDAENFCITAEVSDFRETTSNGFYEKLRQLYGGCRKEGKYYNDEEVDRYYELYSLSGDKMLNEHDAGVFTSINIKAVIGERTARCLRKLFLELGLDKYPSFEHNYAEVADAVSPVEKKLKLVFSVHPCDYLGMSHGNSWESCHGLKNDGCYQGGTMSYMMDEVSIVCYTVPANAKPPYYKIPKISRQMFMLWGDTFLQSRMYPDYDKFPIRITEYRKAFIDVLDTIGEKKEYKMYNRYSSEYAHTANGAAHYPDYNYSQYNTKIYYAGTPIVMEIGHSVICPVCGQGVSDHNHLCCDGRTCSDRSSHKGNQYVGYECCVSHAIGVGGRINPADNNFYSSGYIHRCEICGATIYGDNVHSIEDEENDTTYADYVCDRCYDEYINADESEQEIYWCEGYDEYKCTVFDGAPIDVHGYTYCPSYVDEYYTTCECCGEYVEREYTYSVTNHDGYEEYICEDCYNSHSCRCEECGEVFYEDDMEEYDGDWFCPECYQLILDSLAEQEDDDENDEDETETAEDTGNVSVEVDQTQSMFSRCGFKIGDVVRVTDPGKRYTSYTGWVTANLSAPYNTWGIFSDLADTSFREDRTGQIVGIAPHTHRTPGFETLPNMPILLGVIWEDNKILVINEMGAEKVN